MERTAEDGALLPRCEETLLLGAREGVERLALLETNGLVEETEHAPESATDAVTEELRHLLDARDGLLIGARCERRARDDRFSERQSRS
jgi:hypothetical protein